jgi:hypothetical protein
VADLPIAINLANPASSDSPGGSGVQNKSSLVTKQDLLRKVTLYENILPICSYCKKIRTDPPGESGSGQGYCREDFLSKVKGMLCSHGCCPDCFAWLLPEISEEKTRSS